VGSGGEEARVDLGIAEKPIIGGQSSPRLVDIQRRERCHWVPLRVSGVHEMTGRKRGCRRENAQFLLPGKRMIADRIVAQSKWPRKNVDSLLRLMMRRRARRAP